MALMFQTTPSGPADVRASKVVTSHQFFVLWKMSGFLAGFKDYVSTTWTNRQILCCVLFNKKHTRLAQVSHNSSWRFFLFTLYSSVNGPPGILFTIVHCFGP